MASSSTPSVSRSNKESLEDCMCTICLCILVHPVTLPCGHEMCMPCFKHTVEEASLTCPLCRTRISTWARKASRTNSLVDQKRWEQIQRLFPQRVQRRLDGLDDETDEETEEKEVVDVSYRRMVQLSKPGEIRKEYEEELKRLEAQQEAERQREEEASASLIQKLHSQEEQAWVQARREQEEIAVRDAQLAQELGRLINTAETETPVNRLLQESKVNYPNCPISPSTPSAHSLPNQDGSHKGKQPLVKNSNKTLETFFRRLPADGKRSARCWSEPKTGEIEAAGGKSDVGAVSPRCQSAPVRDKENLPLVPLASPLPTTPHVGEDTRFYEHLELDNNLITNTDSEEGVGTAEMVADRSLEIMDTPVTGQDRVEIINVHVDGQKRPESALTVNSDESDSVILCEEQAEGDQAAAEDDPHFKPIHSSPKAPAQTAANPVRVQPCVVRITPRFLYATDCVSSATFPVVPSPPASCGVPLLGVDRTGINQTVSSVHSDHRWCSQRARSTSPPALRSLPRRRLRSCQESRRRGYCRPSLQEFRMKEKLQPPIEEVVSDSELSSPSPRYKLRHGSTAHRLFRGSRSGRGTVSVLGQGQTEREIGKEMGDSEDEDQHQPLFSAHITDQVVPSGRRASVTSTLHKQPEDLCSSQQSETLSGKGKRLLKKSVNSSLSLRNSPKSSAKALHRRKLEMQDHACHSSVSSERVPGSPGALQHTHPHTEQDSIRTRHRVLTTSAAQSSRSKRDEGGTASLSHSDSDSNDRLVRRVKRANKLQTKTSLPAADKAAETVSSAEGAERVGRKTSRSCAVGHKSEPSGVHQRSIKDWFSPGQAGPNNQKTSQLSSSHRRAFPTKQSKMSESSAVESDTSTPSSAATSPDKLGVRVSQRARRISPKLDEFFLTVTQKLSQFRAGSCADSDSSPVSSPSKAHTTTIKRRARDSSRDRSPATKRRRQSPQKGLATSSSSAGRGGGSTQLKGCHAGSAGRDGLPPQKEDSSSFTAEGAQLTSQPEEAVSQEERDRRMALELQQQFELADRLNLNIVRFKGTDDQYSLRRSRTQTSSKQ
ncbi:uncharacterized protein LOC143289250 [Babylonia areolata]|uniref:uncharacterized protein LOC143289250 n=1 Tax=Babylonia areolata TaxID=304850 RepID=UPI003FD181AD